MPLEQHTQEIAVVRGTKGNQTEINGGDDGNKKAAPRLPRWTRRDLLVLLEGKKETERQIWRAGQRTGLGVGATQQQQPQEPKWDTISSYCRRHGVNRTPAQCRKRWSNLGGDFRKIREWESRRMENESESYWVLRSDLRKERKLPGMFDKVVYDILDGKTVTGMELVMVTEEWKKDDVDMMEEEEGENVAFDSGRTAAGEDALFSEEEEKSPETVTPVASKMNFATPKPISEKRHEPMGGGWYFTPENGKQSSSYPEKGTKAQTGRKRGRTSSDAEGKDISLKDRLVEVLERNSKILTTQLETQNINWHLDRDQRKHQGNSLIGVLDKMADALGRIADKL